MAKISLFICLALGALIFKGLAGEENVRPALRKEFHQQLQYPYVFQPVSYLTEQGPAPMRFGAPVNDCSLHSPPQLTLAKPTPVPAPSPKKEEKSAAQEDPSVPQPAKNSATSQPTAPQSPAPAQETRLAPAYPPPQVVQVSLAPDGVDFTRVPDEVLEYFKNPYNAVPNARRLFDPIFEPAVMQTAPKSKATYRTE